MEYSVNKVKSKIYKKGFQINEWFSPKNKDRKWVKLKKPIGSQNEPITDEQLTEFINETGATEINISLIDNSGTVRNVDFCVTELEK